MTKPGTGDRRKSRRKRRQDRHRFRYESTGDLLGAHVSSQGGVCAIFERGREIGAQALGFFSKNNNRWYQKPLTDEECDEFSEIRDRDLPLLIHAAYLINLAAVDDAVLQRSLDGLTDEIGRADRLGAPYLVLHPGAHMGRGIDSGIDRVARSIDLVHGALEQRGVTLLLETSAGQGSSLCCTFEELGRIRRLVDDPSRIGICVDTCHIFAAGYDIRERDGYERTIEELDRDVGIENVAAFHLNDSKRELGARVDRHESIGKGEIGLDAFAYLLNDERFAGLPKILETPKTVPVETDLENLVTLRSLLNR